MAAVAIGVLLFVFALSTASPGTTGSLRGGDGIKPSMRIAVIADLDKLSKREGSNGKHHWYSVLQPGTLYYNKGSNAFSVSWGASHDIKTQHSEAGRGMELSELVMFGDRLYSMDDRSGIVYEIEHSVTTTPSTYPRYILMEGDADTDKGFKCEWATVKDGHMYVGSFGKEYTRPDGSVVNTNNNWVKVIRDDGSIDHVDWTDNYNALRKHTGTQFPGYMIHEAVIWSEVMQKWVFLPRRVSKLPYDDAADEKRGSNIVILADPTFTQLETRRIGDITPERGFSSAKFVPGSGDKIVVALKSAESSMGEVTTQESFITVFNLEDGTILLPETKLPADHKFEGIEFLP
jgi:soluble calcium-activated nucleotidase 1